VKKTRKAGNEGKRQWEVSHLQKKKIRNDFELVCKINMKFIYRTTKGKKFI
jgi:hypothetical protein